MRYAAVLVALVVLLALLCACDDDYKRADVVLTEEDFGHTVKVYARDVIDLRLQANPTTGYEWAIRWTPREWLRLLDEDYVRGGAMMGAGGVKHFVLRAVQPGQATIELKYGQPWAGGKRQGTWRIKLRISP